MEGEEEEEEAKPTSPLLTTPVMPARSSFFEEWTVNPTSMNAAGTTAGSDDDADVSSMSTDTKLCSCSSVFVAAASRGLSSGISCEVEAALPMAGKLIATSSSSSA